MTEESKPPLYAHPAVPRQPNPKTLEAIQQLRRALQTCIHPHVDLVGLLNDVQASLYDAVPKDAEIERPPYCSPGCVLPDSKKDTQAARPNPAGHFTAEDAIHAARYCWLVERRATVIIDEEVMDIDEVPGAMFAAAALNAANAP